MCVEVSVGVCVEVCVEVCENSNRQVYSTAETLEAHTSIQKQSCSDRLGKRKLSCCSRLLRSTDFLWCRRQKRCRQSQTTRGICHVSEISVGKTTTLWDFVVFGRQRMLGLGRSRFWVSSEAHFGSCENWILGLVRSRFWVS